MSPHGTTLTHRWPGALSLALLSILLAATLLQGAMAARMIAWPDAFATASAACHEQSRQTPASLAHAPCCQACGTLQTIPGLKALTIPPGQPVLAADPASAPLAGHGRHPERPPRG